MSGLCYFQRILSKGHEVDADILNALQGGTLVSVRINKMNCHIFISIIVAATLASVRAVVVSAEDGANGIEISALLVCNDESPALEFKISNNWDEDIEIVKNWLPWNRSPWFEIKMEGSKEGALPSLSRYREDRVVVLRAGEYISGSVGVGRLFPGVEISEPKLISWRMIGAPFRSFFSRPQEGVVELLIRNKTFLTL